MNPLHDLVETRIREAREEGLFDDLPHKGKPVPVENDSRVPAELRGAYSVLKQAGVLPEEMELKKEMLTLGDLIRACHDEDEARTLRRKRSELAVRFQVLMERRGGAGAWAEYAAKIERLGR